MNYITRRIWYIYALYLVLLFFFSSKQQVDFWVILMQFVLSFEYVTVFTILHKSRLRSIIYIVGALLLFNCLFIRLLFSNYGISYFGPDPQDSLTYLRETLATTHLSTSDFIDRWMSAENTNIDDLGMGVIARWAAILGMSESGYITVLLLFNVLALSLSTLFIYKTGLIFLEKETCLLLMIIWGLHQAFIGFSVWGLKENFFLLFIVLAIYNIICFLRKKQLANLISVIIFIMATILFRRAIGAMLTISFLVSVFLPNLKKHRSLALALILLVAYIILNTIDSLILMLGGMGGIEGFLSMAEGNMSSYSITQQYGIQLLYSIIGAPANFIGDIGFNHVMTFSSLINSFMSIFFIIGLFTVWKRGDSISVFLVFYWVLGTGMLILTCRGFDFRFASSFYPALLLMMALGYENRGSFKHKKMVSTFIALVVLGVMYMWNT